MSFWTQSLSDIAKTVSSDVASGLTKEEAKKRLKDNGPNTLPKKKRVNIWALLWVQFSSLLIWLLIAAAIVAAFVGEVIDAWAIIAIVFLNSVLGFFQEFRAEKSLKALQKLAAPACKVVRDGALQTIPTVELVVGDLVLLEAGDRVPADGRIVDLAYLSVEEAALTGESVPVSKTEKELEGELSLGDKKNMVFMGTTIVAGKGHMLVTGTGIETEIGKIADQLSREKKEETPLQRKLDDLGKKLVYACLIIVAIIFGLGILQGKNLVEMLLVAISLAVAAIPEGLPAAVTISLSIGVRRMAERNALVRRLSSVETLGATSVICTDKTGTLTQNAMTVRTIWVDQKFIEVSGSGYEPKGEFKGEAKDLDFALSIGALCNNANILHVSDGWKVAGDPTEGALLTAAAKKGISKHDLEAKYHYVDEIPFDSDRKRMSILREKEGKKILFIKGAVGTLLKRSTKILLDGEESPLASPEAILKANEELVSKAYRVIAVAYQTDFSKGNEEELVLVGLLAMIDPPRPEVKEALELCKRAGIRTLMATGDHKGTAVAIANELGMNEGRAIDGAELQHLSDEELDDITVFSRISAEHKLRIVKALKAKGLVTAMTGDGVNDAPAVKAADIGIAMGITGTDVTKEASDMVILDDNFATIVGAVERGRGIYDNIVKFVSYLLSSNIAEILVIFLMMFFTSFDGKPFIALLPVQLLWMNLVTDGFPAISLALDPIDPRAMTRPPRPRDEQILNKRFSLFVLSISLLVTAGAITACFYGLKTSPQLAQTMTFTTLIVLELVRVQMIRSQYKLKLLSNPYLIGALISSFALQLSVLYIPPLRIVFGTVPLNLIQWGIIFGIAFLLWWAGRFVTKIFYK